MENFGIPSKLYRFQGFTDYSIENLKNNKFYLSVPSDLNDIYEGKTKLYIKSKYSFKSLVYFLSIELPSKGIYLPSNIRSDYLYYWQMANWKGWGTKNPKWLVETAQYARKLINILVNIRGVVSFCENWDDYLMWSLYAGEHKGFCLEFDTKEPPFIYQSVVCKKVVYTNKFPRVLPHRLIHDIGGCAEQILLTKGKKWENEKEWRIIGLKGNESLSYQPEALTSIILGPKMSEEHRNVIKNIFKNQKTEVKQGGYQRSKYQMRIM
jgi:hypothetical protein